MTDIEKKLLISDLCARLPYGVKVVCNNKLYRFVGIQSFNIITLVNDDENNAFTTAGIKYIKPYLFPLSSMTEELWDKEFRRCGITEFTRDSFKYGSETLEFYDNNPDLSSVVRFINLLIKNHFDIHGLIPMGLAVDATGLNIY